MSCIVGAVDGPCLRGTLAKLAFCAPRAGFLRVPGILMQPEKTGECPHKRLAANGRVMTRRAGTGRRVTAARLPSNGKSNRRSGFLTTLRSPISRHRWTHGSWRICDSRHHPRQDCFQAFLSMGNPYRDELLLEAKHSYTLSMRFALQSKFQLLRELRQSSPGEVIDRVTVEKSSAPPSLITN